MKALRTSLLVTIALCLTSVGGSLASASAANISGTWEITIHYLPDDKDYLAIYVLKQEGEKISGTYEGSYGPAEVTGTIKATDVVLSVTVKGSTARFSGKVISATAMGGTVTGTSDKPRKWSAEKKK